HLANNYYTAIVIRKNPTYSTVLCQRQFEDEDSHLKHNMNKVYTGLWTSGRSHHHRLRMSM
ncbi:MAG: hypothetical protein ACXU9M_14110, partial [Thermodesulfobacteriota bacterium]